MLNFLVNSLALNAQGVVGEGAKMGGQSNLTEQH